MTDELRLLRELEAAVRAIPHWDGNTDDALAALDRLCAERNAARERIAKLERVEKAARDLIGRPLLSVLAGRRGDALWYALANLDA